jgi:hypothetical protein
MNSIEDRLRAAMHAAPPVDVRPAPLEEIGRRARRRQALVAVAAAAAIAVLVAGVVVGIPGAGSSRHSVGPAKTPTPNPSASSTAERWRAGVHGVTVGPDGLWIVRADVRHGQESWYLDRQNGLIGHVDTVPPSADRIVGPVSQVTSGLGGVWTWGGGDGAYPNGHLDVLGVGPASVPYGGWPELPHSGISGLTFVDGTPYAAIYGLNRVEAVPEATAVSASYAALPGSPTAIVSTRAGQVWVRVQTGSTSRLMNVVTSGGGVALGPDSFTWPGPILGADHGNEQAIWTSDSKYRVIEFDPAVYAKGAASLAYVGDRLPVPGRATRVLEDGSGGLYVAVDGGWAGAKTGIAYYDAKARLDEGGPSPTAFLPTQHPAEALVLDPDAGEGLGGGVVFTTTDFVEYHWNPTAS